MHVLSCLAYSGLYRERRQPRSGDKTKCGTMSLSSRFIIVFTAAIIQLCVWYIAILFTPYSIQSNPMHASLFFVLFCTKLRVGGNEKVVHSFRRSDPLTALLDVAAQALAKSDGKALGAPFDLIAPGGRPLLRAGVIAAAQDGGSDGGGTAGAGAGEEEGGGGGPTIGSEQLGGASVIVRRT